MLEEWFKRSNDPSQGVESGAVYAPCPPTFQIYMLTVIKMISEK